MPSKSNSDRAYNKIVNAWCMYDWANSAYATTVMAAMLPPYFSSVAQEAGFTGAQASSMWGYVTSLTMLIIAITSPILGAIADYTGSKKKFLFGFFIVAIAFTSLLVFIGTGDWLLCLIFFALAGIGNAGANVFYDSLLPHVAKSDEIDQVSAKGYALGYLGGGLLLILNLLMFTYPGWFGIPSENWGVRLSFLSVGLWWAVFSIPLFRHVKEPPRSSDYEATVNPIRAGFQRLGHTFRDLRRYKQLLLFLVAFWLYADGIGTIMKMATIYGTEIGIGMTDLVGALLLTQFVGVPFTFLFGWLARRLGTKRSIFLALSVYVLVSLGGYFMAEAWHFWLLAFMVGLVQGGSQALSRSLFGSMTPKARSAEFFGFFDISSKFAGIAGPLLFGVVGQLTGTSRLSIASLVVFFVVGMLLLRLVDEEEGIRVAEEENRAAGTA
ncbi:MAG: MFS transporter [Chloroflexota bacterium]|nr:MFS transporter [Chloroflexota bacterium]